MIYRRFPHWAREDEMWSDGSEYQGHLYLGHIPPYQMVAEMIDGFDRSKQQVIEALRHHGQVGMHALIDAITEEWACLCMDRDAFADCIMMGKDPYEEPWDIYHLRTKPDPMPLEDGEPLYLPVTIFDVYRMDDALRAKGEPK